MLSTLHDSTATTPPPLTSSLQSYSPQELARAHVLGWTALNFPGYIVGRHHALIAKYLMMVEAGLIDRLMIFMPPRMGKTMLVSESFVPWYLGRNPTREVISSTYSFERAGDTGRKVRNQLDSQVFRACFPQCVLSPDSKGQNKLSTLQGGNYYSVGVNGALTGRGGHLFLIDDPVKNRKEAMSETYQRQMRDWFSSVAYTRLAPQNAIILIMTRWAYNDLAGWLLEEKGHENWVVLKLPAIATEDDDLIGRQMGDPLWPERFPLEFLERTRRTILPRDWSALYQQEPAQESGAMVDLSDFKRYSWNEWFRFKNSVRTGDLHDPPFGIKKIVCSWDTAFKEQEINDPSACTVWGVTKNKNCYLLFMFVKRMEFPELKKAVIQIHSDCKKYGLGPVPVLIEDKASGQSLIQVLQKESSIPIIKIKPDANKVIRFDESSDMISGGKVYLPEHAPWLAKFESQITRFPMDKEDDIVDSTSQFLRWVNQKSFIRSKFKRYWK